MAHHYDHYAAEEWAAHGGDYQISVNNTFVNIKDEEAEERAALAAAFRRSSAPASVFYAQGWRPPMHPDDTHLVDELTGANIPLPPNLPIPDDIASPYSRASRLSSRRHSVASSYQPSRHDDRSLHSFGASGPMSPHFSSRRSSHIGVHPDLLNGDRLRDAAMSRRASMMAYNEALNIDGVMAARRASSIRPPSSGSDEGKDDTLGVPSAVSTRKKSVRFAADPDAEADELRQTVQKMHASAPAFTPAALQEPTYSASSRPPLPYAGAESPRMPDFPPPPPVSHHVPHPAASPPHGHAHAHYAAHAAHHQHLPRAHPHAHAHAHHHAYGGASPPPAYVGYGGASPPPAHYGHPHAHHHAHAHAYQHHPHAHHHAHHHQHNMHGHDNRGYYEEYGKGYGKGGYGKGGNKLHQQPRNPKQNPPPNGRINDEDRNPEDDIDAELLIHIDKIHSGEETRTTCIVTNIPNRMTIKMLKTIMDRHLAGKYRFLTLPLSQKRGLNMGYGFIDFYDAKDVELLHKHFQSQGWTPQNPNSRKSSKRCLVSYARVQGPKKVFLMLARRWLARSSEMDPVLTDEGSSQVIFDEVVLEKEDVDYIMRDAEIIAAENGESEQFKIPEPSRTPTNADNVNNVANAAAKVADVPAESSTEGDATASA